MLLGNKKKQSEQNWCIVLNPLRNEIDKKKIAHQISEVFSLSAEEAADLVSNTPIILLDNLTRTTASRVKEYFRPSGAEMILTNDIFLKRKCYRTVWPEPPNLSFLERWEHPKGEQEEDPHVLGADEALKEIRSLNQEAPKDESENPEEISDGLAEVERRQMLEELDRWRNECMTRREEIGRLREVIERLQKDRIHSDPEKETAAQRLEEKEKQLELLRAQVTQIEDKYDSLREEYRQARELFEERMTKAGSAESGDLVRYQNLVRTLENKNRETEERARQLELLLREKENEKSKNDERTEDRVFDLLRDLDAQKAQNRSLKDELERFEKEKAERDAQMPKAADLEARLVLMRDEVYQERKRNQEIREELQAAESIRTEWEQKVELLARQLTGIEELHRNRTSSLEEQLSRGESERRQWEDRFLEAQEREACAARERDELLQELEQKKQQESERQERLAFLEQEYQRLKIQYEDASFLLKQTEERQKGAEEDRRMMAESLKQKEEAVLTWEKKIADLEATMAELDKIRAAQEQMLQEKGKQLEMRERELEASRRQLREMTQQVEQREMAQKRAQISNQLAEKEIYLKRLVHEQEKFEGEIRQREESMRDIMAQQELLEKEIIEIKQTQRHLLEQTKKERASRGRVYVNGYRNGGSEADEERNTGLHDRTGIEQDKS